MVPDPAQRATDAFEGFHQDLRKFKRDFIIWMLIFRISEVLIYVAVLLLFFRDLSRW
jgi:hypothetical protein